VGFSPSIYGGVEPPPSAIERVGDTLSDVAKDVWNRVTSWTPEQRLLKDVPTDPIASAFLFDVTVRSQPAYQLLKFTADLGGQYVKQAVGPMFTGKPGHWMEYQAETAQRMRKSMTPKGPSMLFGLVPPDEQWIIPGAHENELRLARQADESTIGQKGNDLVSALLHMGALAPIGAGAALGIKAALPYAGKAVAYTFPTWLAAWWASQRIEKATTELSKSIASLDDDNALIPSPEPYPIEPKPEPIMPPMPETLEPPIDYAGRLLDLFEQQATQQSMLLDALRDMSTSMVNLPLGAALAPLVEKWMGTGSVSHGQFGGGATTWAALHPYLYLRKKKKKKKSEAE
jgi:hypothetical protein